MEALGRLSAHSHPPFSASFKMRSVRLLGRSTGMLAAIKCQCIGERTYKEDDICTVNRKNDRRNILPSLRPLWPLLRDT